MIGVASEHGTVHDDVQTAQPQGLKGQFCLSMSRSDGALAASCAVTPDAKPSRVNTNTIEEYHGTSTTPHRRLGAQSVGLEGVALDVVLLAGMIAGLLGVWCALGVAAALEFYNFGVTNFLAGTLPAMAALLLTTLPLVRKTREWLVDGAAARVGLWMTCMSFAAAFFQHDCFAVLDESLGPLILFVTLAGLFGALGAVVACSSLLLPVLRPLATRRIALYGATAYALQVRSHLLRTPNVEFSGLYDQRGPARVVKSARSLLRGSLVDLIELIKAGKIDTVLIPLHKPSRERLAAIVDRLSAYSIDVWVCDRSSPGYHVAVENDTRSVSITNSVVTRIHRPAIRFWGAIAKSVVDRCLALLLMATLWPLFFMIAAAIKVDSKGPVFFRQRRHGFNGNVILVWKFRSMRTLDDGAIVRQARQNDSRITRVGTILRRTSLDELPQLINILCGEMSFVGPRPHAIAHNEHYERLISHYAGRNQVKPGLTGWAQVNGLRGETIDPADMTARVHCDLWYISNWSLLLDLKIILLTPIYGLATPKAR